ncbi:RHS repeat domain-containing protein [Porphyromonas sp.]|uniref:RHS repeat domain-containing protein n=1 Tax=Porphyromonas sp. TaxID=1924944 RepID=UPI0026DD5EA8|nr:hypothetical protein [Porphyromonas sp.]MDO4695743.1 hypothetical protein [Porphyromonas sp.]MDO4771772.1 hypothetical protein [Porphyromonas sp.]
MKIKISILTAMMLFLGVACTQTKKGSSNGDNSKLSEYELVGNVKSVSEKSYATGTVDGEPVNILYTDIHRVFDEDGRVLSEEVDSEGEGYTASYTYDADGNMVKLEHTLEYEGLSTTENTYDAKGNLIRSVFSIKDSLQFASRDEYVYDKNNNLIEQVTYSGEFGEHRIAYVYDEKNRLIETRADSGDEMPNKTIHTYNEIDSLASVKSFSSSGVLLEETLYSYNEKGIKTKSEYKSFDEEGKMNYRRLEHFDDRGNATLQENHNIEGVLTDKTENTYDAQGRVIESVHYVVSEGNALTIEYQSKYKYDDKGNLVEEVSDFPVQGYSQTLLRTYEYDHKGNWIRMVLTQIYEKEELPMKNITERRITYYD